MTRLPKMDRASKAEVLEARRAGGLNLSSLVPLEAFALWQLDLLNENDVVELANNWLMNGLDQGSYELASIAIAKPESVIDVKPAFEKAFEQMNVVPPSDNQSFLIVLEIYLRQIVMKNILPMAGMAALNGLYIDEFDNQDRIVIRHPKFVSSEHENYMGSKLGLEYLYTWYREFQDAIDDATWYYTELPFEAQLDKFDENLVEEAEILLNHVRSLHPEIFKRDVM